MESKLITCPESAHLAQIKYEDHPFGLLIVACSEFQPACAVTCPRTCAVRFDRRDLLEPSFDGDDDEDTLINMPAARFCRSVG